jgi:hypothetical protein
MPFKPQFDLEDKELETVQRVAPEKVKREHFLDLTSMIESSSGRNLRHKKMKDGLHAGERAVGQYGLMPNSIEEMTRRIGKNIDPRIKEIMSREDLDSQQKADLIAANPELERIITDKMYDHLNSRYKGDEELMNYGWQYGHNTPLKDIDRSKVEKVERTEKFRRLKGKIK